MAKVLINLPSLVVPSGYSHAIVTKGGRLVFLAGQTGMDATGRIASPGDLVAQFHQALANIQTILAEAGGTMTDIVQMTFFVTDKAAYRASLTPIGEVYRAFFGRYYPAITLVEVNSLFDDEALIEIAAVAVIAEGE